MSKKQLPSNSSVKSFISKSILKLKNLLGVLIAFISLLLYVQSISFDYNLDDSVVILANNNIKQGIAGIPIILTKDRLFGVEEQALRTPEYRPASFVLFAIEWEFFPNNPQVSHFMNVLLYSLTCWLLFLLLCQLFTEQSLIIPFICSLLFTLHPIHTEVVDNIKSRDEILCLLFGILSIILFLKTLKSKSFPLKFIAGFCFFISLLSKETGISFLIIIPLILFVFKREEKNNLFSITIVLVFTSALFFLIRALVLASAPPTNFNLNNNSISLVPDFFSREATAFYVLLKYISLLIFPHPLSYDYSFNQIPTQSISNPLVILSLIIYLTIGVYAVLKINSKNIFAFAILFFLISLAPVSNIFLLIGSNMAERFLYIPSLGFCIFLSFVLLKIIKPKASSRPVDSVREFIKTNSVILSVIGLIGSLYAFKTINRNPDWKDSISLHSHDVQVAANSARTHFNWGVSLLTELYPNEQNKSAKAETLQLVINELKTTIAIFPNNSEAHFNLADAYRLQKDYPNAIKHYEITNRLFSKPNFSIYQNLGYLYGETGQYEKALQFVDSAIKANPNYPDPYGNKGNILYKMGSFSQAIACFQKVIDFNPRKSLAYKMIGNCYLNLKDTLQANVFFEKANTFNNRRK